MKRLFLLVAPLLFGVLSQAAEVKYFDVPRGASVAVVGVSGSGKSTLLGLLAGLDVPSAGSVALDGRDLFTLDEDARAALRARLVGIVFQNFQLLPVI